MEKKSQLLRLMLGLSLVLGWSLGCGGSSTETPETGAFTGLAEAREALASFFSLLHDGQYGQAISYYGGDYEVLREWNPDVPGDDLAKLFENGCTVNGLQCVEIKTVLQALETSPGLYTFTVEFAEDDGRLFTRGTESQFTYTVRKVNESFLVQELPVYIP
jgi:hypothetical protein